MTVFIVIEQIKYKESSIVAVLDSLDMARAFKYAQELDFEGVEGLSYTIEEWDVGL